MPGQIVGHARVSSTSQNLDRQLATIGQVEEMFTDRVSGKNRQDRAGLEAALHYLRRGDTLRVASMDRFAWSLVDLEQLVDELTGRGVTVEFVKERLTFAPGADDPFATFQRQLVGVVAELERSLIQSGSAKGSNWRRPAVRTRDARRPSLPTRRSTPAARRPPAYRRRRSLASWDAPEVCSTTRSQPAAPLPAPRQSSQLPSRGLHHHEPATKVRGHRPAVDVGRREDQRERDAAVERVGVRHVRDIIRPPSQ